MRFVVDLESNWLLHEMDRVHCIVLRDIDTGEVHSCADQEGYKPIQHALDLLLKAKQIVGHNTAIYFFKFRNHIFA